MTRQFFAEPSHDCPLCPRLADFRTAWRIREPGWFNGPVPTFLEDEAAFADLDERAYEEEQAWADEGEPAA